MSDPSIQEFPSAPLDNSITSSVPSPAATAGGRSAKSALFIVFLVVVIDLLGFGIVLPLLPRTANFTSAISWTRKATGSAL